MFERFTEPARTVVRAAFVLAGERGGHGIGTEHLLLALADDRPGGVARDTLVAAGLDRAAVLAGMRRHPRAGSLNLSEADAEALRTVGIDLDAVLARVTESFGPDALHAADRPARRSRWHGAGGFTPEARKAIELSLREALRLKHRYIGTEHLLLGLVRGNEGPAALILADAGLDPATVRAAVETRLREAA
jgi:ATP-dependent Clp protease ATP-binding subunit ClpA